jgi:ABC-2 type transport system permease protein
MGQLLHMLRYPSMTLLPGLVTRSVEAAGNAVLAVVWCAAISLAGFLWARSLFERDPAS